MATTFGPGYAGHPRQAVYSAPATYTPSAPPAPSGTFARNTKVQVGSHRVVIEKYLSEGGFAHVYIVRLPKPVNGKDTAVLKRVAVPDKENLASMRTEVETMQKLKGHRHIVTYIDSHASQLKGGGYEVFLLMEYCNGGGLIDFMNTRLQNRLTEPEILKIFSDVAQGVSCMHYLKPPLLHRDLKVENVLINSSGSSKLYKLCDFGSTAPARPAATNAQEGRLIEEDVQKNTTLQYRSPEMIDVYRKQPIDEKSDIWALGVLLYKLCYYTTPFEEQGQMAILNASFKYPAYPSFSDRIKKLIALMLREDPTARPNIYQVVREVCAMRGTDLPIKDIYTRRTPSEARRKQQLPTPDSNNDSPPVAGAFKAPVVEEKPVVPDIVPMRRGRPTKNEQSARTPKPSLSPLRATNNDPFGALDAPQKSFGDQAALDKASSRFPPLDQFSLLHDSGSKFAFDPPSKTTPKASQDISQRVTNALADEAFAQSVPLPKDTKGHSQREEKAIPRPADSRIVDSDAKPTPRVDSQPSVSHRPNMVSTGTMTSPSPRETFTQSSTITPRPVFRFPPSPVHRSLSQPRASDASLAAAANIRADAAPQKRPGLLDHRSKSQIGTLDGSKSSASSRPSLEGLRPSKLEQDNILNRSKSANYRTRPVSDQLSSKLGLRHGHDMLGRQSPVNITESLPSVITGEPDNEEAKRINSSVDFLRAMEEEDPSRRPHKRSGSGSKHVKRASMPSISLAGTKNLLAGRFGEAFRRFENTTSGSGPRSPSLSPTRGLGDLTPIAGSEATDGRSDDGNVLEETETPPEVRRELERRRLSQEEKRVADAAAAYRQRMAQGGMGSRGRPTGDANSRATSIQNKVKSLLDESGRASPTKTAEGYGRFTHSPDHLQQTRNFERTLPNVENSGHPMNPMESPRISNPAPTAHNLVASPRPMSMTAPLPERPPSRPSAPPKPHALRTGAREEQRPSSPPKPSRLAGKALPQPPKDLTASEAEEWEANFNKKYPSLAGLEMVETEIDRGAPANLRIRDV